MVILRTRNKIIDFLMILAWASPFKGNYFHRFPQVSSQECLGLDYLMDSDSFIGTLLGGG